MTHAKKREYLHHQLLGMCRSVELWWMTVSEAAPTWDERQLCLVLPAHRQQTRSHLHVSQTLTIRHEVSLYYFTISQYYIPHQQSVLLMLLLLIHTHQSDIIMKIENTSQFTQSYLQIQQLFPYTANWQLITCFTALKNLHIGLCIIIIIIICMLMSLTIDLHGSHLDIQYSATHVDITAHWRENCLSASVVNRSTVTDHTMWQPGFNLPYGQWQTINHTVDWHVRVPANKIWRQIAITTQHGVEVK